MPVLTDYFERVRAEAEAQAFELEKKKIRDRRDHEQYMRKRRPDSELSWDDLTLEDVEIMKQSGKDSLLLEEPGFFERVEVLTTEREDAIRRVKQAGQEAVLRAAQNPPPEVEALDVFEKDRARFLDRAGVVGEENIANAPKSVQSQFTELVATHVNEIRERFPS